MWRYIQYQILKYILYTLSSTLSPKIHEKVRKWIETSETDIHNVLDNKYEAVVSVFIMLSNVLTLYVDHVFGFQKYESNISQEDETKRENYDWPRTAKG